MYQVLLKNIEKTKYFLLSALIIVCLFLVTVVYKNDQEIGTSKTNISIEDSDLTPIKEFLLKKIKSPFINVSHTIKGGDSIQKFLKNIK